MLCDLDKYLFPYPPGDSGQVAFEEIFEIVELRETWIKCQRPILTSCTDISSGTHLENCIYQFCAKIFKISSIFPYESPRK